MKKILEKFPFEVRGVKNYRGHGGEPLRQGTLWYQGRKIGFIGEGDHGGPATVDIREKADEAIVDAYIKAQPRQKLPVEFDDGRDNTYAYDEDLFVMDAFAYTEIRKKVAKAQKDGKVCFVIETDEDWMFRYVTNVSGKPIEEVVNYLTKKYGNFEILR